MPEIRLRCVQCGHAHIPAAAGDLSCPACGHIFPRHAYRLTPVLIGTTSQLNLPEILAYSPASQKADLAAAQRHWQTGKLIPLLESCPGKRLLNYGSGDGGDRKWLESRGYGVTTFDVYPGEFTDYVCDGHNLPFADEQFEIVTSTAVFEHLHDPFQAAREIHRVLIPGGAHVGSVAFLEPFHANSYFHMSHLGVREIFLRAGFRSVKIYPGWSYLEALNSQYFVWNRFRPVRVFTRLWARAAFGWGKLLWRIGYAARGRPLPERITLGFCGSLIFKAVK